MMQRITDRESHYLRGSKPKSAGINTWRQRSLERFDDVSLDGFCESLIWREGGDHQRDFLEAARNSETFCAYVEEKIGIREGKNLPLLRKKLSDSDFQEMALDTEQEIFSLWRSISKADASRKSFWGMVSFRNIQNGLVESHFLATKGPLSGKECIERVLRGTNQDDKETDRVVRNILRRFCGLKAPRGFRSLYVDCVLARAWWRNWFCEEVCRSSGAHPDKVSNLFHTSQIYWENLVQCALYGNWEWMELKPLYAIVWALSEQLDEDHKSHLDTKGLKALLKLMRLSRHRKGRKSPRSED